ncbi:hypothetical protein TEA_021097 [Camellia sinensis var. sinensis]|uniref:Cation-transporting P-type ATPase C-terminal domain-containing protein n=1 Tax=Camellia sinensis var. sinensis TaxID=542762 RepID=A0A4S4DBD6_CAMSN|nr:hypothetical protein TEA_021097 [Camellia sinensis var. sinensis]
MKADANCDMGSNATSRTTKELHNVVRWGRSVYANIQKFIQFQLTVNVAALVINVVAAVSSGDVPLTALLWVNLIMDTLGALALATEPPTDHLMHRPPVGRREPLMVVFDVCITLISLSCSSSQGTADNKYHVEKHTDTGSISSDCSAYPQFPRQKYPAFKE